MFHLEDSHWWFVARRNLLGMALERALPAETRPWRILDVGCGTGGTMDRLRAFGHPFGADLEPLALSLCRERGHRDLTLSSATALPFAEEAFDVVVALDVLEHIPDHEAAMREIARVLRPGGVAIVTVPAYRSLWSRHDVALHHVRRYRAGEVRTLLTGAGLRTERLTYTVCALFPIVWCVRMFQRRFQRDARPVADAQPTSPGLNALLRRGLDLESRLIQRLALPFGLTVFAVARKPAGGTMGL